MATLTERFQSLRSGAPLHTCGFGSCRAKAVAHTWQTRINQPGVVSQQRPLCAEHLIFEAAQTHVDKQFVLHVAALGTAVAA